MMGDFAGMTTAELIDMLLGYSLGLKESGNIAGGLLCGVAADRLMELEEKLNGISHQGHPSEVR